MRAVEGRGGRESRVGMWPGGRGQEGMNGQSIHILTLQVCGLENALYSHKQRPLPPTVPLRKGCLGHSGPVK